MSQKNKRKFILHNSIFEYQGTLGPCYAKKAYFCCAVYEWDEANNRFLGDELDYSDKRRKFFNFEYYDKVRDRGLARFTSEDQIVDALIMSIRNITIDNPIFPLAEHDVVETLKRNDGWHQRVSKEVVEYFRMFAR